MISVRTIVGGLLVSSLCVIVLGAQTTVNQASAQQQANDDVLKELKAIHQLLERLVGPAQQGPTQPPKPVRTKVSNLKGYALGQPDAPLTMVEFSDLQCPFCRQYTSSAFEEIRTNWIDTGKLRYISRDFPLDFHPQAVPAAQAARCAGEQGRYWDVRLALMKTGNTLSSESIKKTVSGRIPDEAAFAQCMESNKYAVDISRLLKK